MHERMPWAAVDDDLRAAVEGLLGARVVAAQSQPGGFSPGSADRVELADGRRAFVKTGADAVNPDVVRIHRAESRVTALLDHTLPVPRLIGMVDLGDRIALVLEDVEGRHPTTPWVAHEITAVLDALHEIGRQRVPAEAGLPEMAEAGAEHYGPGWVRLGDRLPDLPEDLGDWARSRRDWLRTEGLLMGRSAAGDRLVHHDARADNILVRPDGTVVVIDWPWGARGAGWLDALTLLFNIRYYDPAADVEELLSHPAFEEMAREDADRVLVGLAGHFLFVSQEPAVPGIPSLREFQFDQAVTILGWLRERLD